MAVTAKFFGILLLLSISSLDQTTAAVVICDPSAAPLIVTVARDERVVFKSKNYPSPYPFGICGVSFQPATSDIRLVLVFENFETFDDTFDFYANVTNNSTGNSDLQVVASVDYLWHTAPNFLYPQSRRGPIGADNYSGIIQTRFNAISNKPASGFIAHVIAYDIMGFNLCLPPTHSLAAEESFLVISPGAPFFHTYCNSNVKPADSNTRLEVILNYANLPHDQVLILTDGYPTQNISGSNYKLSDPDSIMGNIGNVIYFQYSQLDSSPQNDSSLYIMVVRGSTAPGDNSSSSTNSVPTPTTPNDSSFSPSATASSTSTTPNDSSFSPVAKSAPLFTLISFFVVLKSSSLLS